MIRNRTRPSAKAASVLALSNSWSPVSSWTIWTVTVVTLANGLAVRLAARPGGHDHDHRLADRAADREQDAADDAGKRRRKEDLADGLRRVAPSARLPSRIACGTAAIESSAIELTNGMIITPMTRPAASALSLLAGFDPDRDAEVAHRRARRVSAAK